MKVAFVQHFPADLEEEYGPLFARFARSCLCAPPAAPKENYEHIIAVSGLLPGQSVNQSWTCNRMHTYTGTGLDIGSYIDVAKTCDADFMICCSASIYFHRAGAIARFIEAREKCGPGLYAASASFEGSPLGLNPCPNPHIRTSFFGCDPKVLRDYPHEIKSREDCYRFEGGAWKISRHIRPVRMVTWNGIYDLKDCRSPANCFRRGNQSAMLVFDRRTDEYEHANAADKKRLERLADGDIAQLPQI